MLLFYTISVGINGFFRYNRFQQEYRVKQARYDELNKRYRSINQMITQLNQLSEWEQLSRSKLHMIKPGEKSYLFYYQGTNKYGK